MKKGFIVEKDGKYLVYSEITTHTGTHRRERWVDNINEATLFPFVPHSIREKGVRILQAVEIRSIIKQDLFDTREKMGSE